MGKLIREGAFELPCCSGIISALCSLDSIAEALEVVEFRRGVRRLENFTMEHVFPPFIVSLVSIRIVQSLSTDIVCQTGNRAVFAATNNLYFQMEICHTLHTFLNPVHLHVSISSDLISKLIYQFSSACKGS